MPSNKIYTVLVLCLGIVVSIWLLQRKAVITPVTTGNNVVAVKQDENTNYVKSDDWNKILVSIQSKDQDATATPITDDPNTFDGTTVTAQVARDLFSRYLLIANNGQNITPDQEDQIVDEVLSSPDYTKGTGAVYTLDNLNIDNNTDLNTLKKYGDTINQILKTRIAEIKVTKSPTDIVDKALTDNNPDELSDLDSIVKSGKDILSDLLKMEVPTEVAAMHLDLLNASSNLESNLEAMQVTFTDPVRSFVAVNQYSQHFTDTQTALAKINTYYKQRFSTSQ